MEKLLHVNGYSLTGGVSNLIEWNCEMLGWEIYAIYNIHGMILPPQSQHSQDRVFHNYTVLNGSS